jgi:hypothetical protein
MLGLLGFSLASAVTGAAAPGPCDLVSRAAASAILEAPVTKMEPGTPERDEDTGGMRTLCAYMAGTRMLMVVREVFASAAAAKEATTKELVTDRLEDEHSTVTEAPGLGDKAYWATTPHAAEWVVIKGSSVLGVTLGGMPKPPATYQAQLRTVTVGVLGKL